MTRRELFSLISKVGIVAAAQVVPWKVLESFGLVEEWFAEAATLPQGYQVSAGTRFIDTQVGIAGASSNALLSGGGTSSGVDNTNSAFLLNVTWNINSDFSRNPTFGFWLYIVNAADLTNVSFLVSEVTNFATRFNFNEFGFHEGWNYFQLHRGEATNTLSPSWANAQVRFRISITTSSSTSNDVVAYLQGVWAGAKAAPQYVWVFDDCYAAHYTDAFPYMQARGIKGTIALISNTIDQSLRLTRAQLDEMYAAGWDIINHTTDHTPLGSLGTVGEVKAKLEPTMAIMQQYGWTRGLYHMATPSGSTSDIVRQACQELGFITVRSATGKVQQTVFGLAEGDRYDVWSQSLDNPNTVSNFQAFIANAHKRCGTMLSHTHDIVGTPTSGSILLSDMKQMLDIIYRTGIPNRTYTEWYNGLTNPRRKRVP